MSGAPLFSRRLLAAWIAMAAILFTLSLHFMDRGSGKGTGSDDVGPTVFSRSAIGHAGLAELLGRLGIPVAKSRYGMLGTGGNDVTVLAEPQPTGDFLPTLQRLLASPRILLVLPKRAGMRSRKQPSWLSGTFLLPEDTAGFVLGLLDSDIKLVRVDRVGTWKLNELGSTPDIPSPVQLMNSKALRPVVASDDGILVGELERGNRDIWILADPDIIENHGITRGGNAAFAVALLNEVRMFSHRLLFDEAEHGYAARPPGPLKLLFTFPYVFATLQGGIAIALLLWATVGRFGKPEPVPPALAAGKQGLIRNAASLIGLAGQRPAIVRRYVTETLQDAARQLHAPAGLAGEALVAWLQRVSRARGVAIDCAEVAERMSKLPAWASGADGALESISRDIYRWKRGIIDGHPADPRDHRGYPRRGP